LGGHYEACGQAPDIAAVVAAIQANTVTSDMGRFEVAILNRSRVAKASLLNKPSKR
jgi:hypothetical protein